MKNRFNIIAVFIAMLFCGMSVNAGTNTGDASLGYWDNDMLKEWTQMVRRV